MPTCGESGYDAVLLAGGRAHRLGGVHKPGLEVGGVPVVQRVAEAVPGAGRLVVAGPPEHAPDRAVSVCEDPPGCGPIPALRAAMPRVQASWMALLAGDLPFLRPRDITDLRGCAADSQGAVLVDDDNREQWLIGFWWTAALRTALPGYDGGSVRGLLGGLGFVRVRPEVLPGTPPPWLDCDTPGDLDVARRWACRI